MAKFCKYCGNPLSEAGVCDCTQATADMEERAKAQVLPAMEEQPVRQPTLPRTPQPAPIPTPAPQTAPQAVPKDSNAAKYLTEIKDIFLQFWKSPVSLFRSAVQMENKTPQLLMAVLFALLTIIIVCSAGKGNVYMEDAVFEMGFITALTFVVIRLAYSGGVYVLAKRKNSALNFKTVAGVFSITFAFDVVMLLLLVVFSMISLVELIIAVLLFWLVTTAVLSYIAAWVVMGEDIEATYKATLIVQAVLMVALVFIIRGVAARTMVSDIVDFLM